MEISFKKPLRLHLKPVSNHSKTEHEELHPSKIKPSLKEILKKVNERPVAGYLIWANVWFIYFSLNDLKCCKIIIVSRCN